MSLGKDEVGNIYKSLKDIINKSKIYDEGLIPSIYNILIKNLFDELTPRSSGCTVLKSQYLMGEITFAGHDIVEKIHKSDDLYVFEEEYRIKQAKEILKAVTGLKSEEQITFPILGTSRQVLKFIITPTFKSIQDDDLMYIFKALQEYSHDVRYNEDAILYDIFQELIKSIFEDFHDNIYISRIDTHIDCEFGNEMEKIIAADTFINYFDFEKDDTLIEYGNQINIYPVDRKKYEIREKGGEHERYNA